MTAPGPSAPAGTGPASGPGRHRLGLSARTVLLTSAVAAVAVLVAGLVSYPLIRGAAETQARSSLSRLADLTVTALDQQSMGMTELPQRVAAALRVEEVVAYLVTDRVPDLPPGMRASDRAALLRGESVSTVTEVNGTRMFVEGRPIGNGVGVVLFQEASVTSGPVSDVVRRLLLALFVGLAIAALFGLLAARRITRPLRSAAEAANRLSAGERDVRVAPEGPTEVADIADSLNRLNDSLRASEQRQREFLLSVSHELRTPLTAVKGYAEALADGVVPAEDVPRTGAVMGSEAARLDRLVTDLLDLNRLGADNFRTSPVDVDLARVGRDAAAVWHDRCSREGVPFRAELPAGPLPAHTDPMRVRQIIDNLAENALRVTPEGRPIVLAVRREGDWAVVELRDGGPGLTGADTAVAFEPGVLHERYRGIRKVGTGLGLALVGRLATGLGGSAEAGSAAEGGARFTIRIPAGVPLPAAAPGMPPTAARPGAPPAAAGPGVPPAAGSAGGGLPAPAGPAVPLPPPPPSGPSVAAVPAPPAAPIGASTPPSDGEGRTLGR